MVILLPAASCVREHAWILRRVCPAAATEEETELSQIMFAWARVVREQISIAGSRRAGDRDISAHRRSAK